MERVKLAVIFGGCSEEHPISVKSAQEVATHLTSESTSRTTSGSRRAVPGSCVTGPHANWESADCRPAMLSPDRGVHGLLVLEQERYETIPLDVVLSGPPRLKLARTGRCRACWSFPAFLMSVAMSRVPPCAWTNPWPTSWREALGSPPRRSGPSRPSEQIDPECLEYPVFVKPARSGSSFGVSKVSRKEELRAAVETARQYDSKVLIEEAVVGMEVGCALFGNDTDLIGGRAGSRRRFRMGSSGSIRRRSPKRVLKTQRSSYPPIFQPRPARWSGDGQDPLSRLGMSGAWRGWTCS